MFRWLWPPIDDVSDSIKVARSGSAAAFLCAIVTGALTWFSTKGHSLIEGLSALAYIDAVIFLIVGFGILKMSRIAALAGLGIYIWGKYDLWQTMGPSAFRAPYLIILFTIYFINSVRGTFAYHSMKEKGKSLREYEIAIKEAHQAAQEASPPLIRSRPFIFAALVLLILCATAFAAFLAPRFLKKELPDQNAASAEVKTQAEKPSGILPESAASASSGALEKTFYLKSGEAVRGKVVFEDETYANVETISGLKTVIKEDLDLKKMAA